MRGEHRGARRARTLVLAALPLLLSIACGGGGDSDAAGPAQPRATTVRTAAASPTQSAAAFNPSRLSAAAMAMEQVTSLLGANIQTLRDKVTDPNLPFSSAPAIGAALSAQSVHLIYSSYQAGAAPAAGRPFAVQNTVQGYPSAANATAAFTALRTTWQGTLFQNLQQQPNLGAAWEESFCQLGNFATAGGQQQQWFVCMARQGPYVATVSIGSFPNMDVNFVAPLVRSYFDEASRGLR